MTVPLTLFAIQLRHGILSCKSVGLKLEENILGNFSLLRGGCSAKMVEGQIEPFIDTLVNAVIFVAKGLA